MGNIIGILAGTDEHGQITQYATKVDENNVVKLSTDSNSALRFNTIEDAQSYFTTSGISFRKIENGKLMPL
ncbi:hypothetical protein F3J02_01490 [Acinetobacter sp. Tr-809]|uniref:hypothetical protein n=1 Tax=Acinetobacter sp. Tr-809 TaxID=2608324 RepID=UPI00141EAD3A|nr:hypothetical protein [Acinetobacter sp. Tr-809]NIE95167.1 hypothetical protein [Acinetobacter sp. Tr-809]